MIAKFDLNNLIIDMSVAFIVYGQVHIFTKENWTIKEILSLHRLLKLA